MTITLTLNDFLYPTKEASAVHTELWRCQQAYFDSMNAADIAEMNAECALLSDEMLAANSRLMQVLTSNPKDDTNWMRSWQQAHSDAKLASVKLLLFPLTLDDLAQETV